MKKINDNTKDYASDVEKDASETIRKIFSDIEQYGFSRQKPKKVVFITATQMS